MCNFRLLSFILIALLFACPSSRAQHFPLPGTTPSTDATEGTAPFLLPVGVTQTLIADRVSLTALGLPPSFGTWDMVGFDETSRYIFIPCEVASAAGVFSYDTLTGQFKTLMLGNGTGNRESDPQLWNANNDEFLRLDPATYTPWGTLITGEETTGGRLFEITNPKTTGTPVVEWRSQIPAVSHEGLRFDDSGSLYFVDENNSGSIYKFVPTTPGDLSQGQSFVLQVDAYGLDPNAIPTANWSDNSNLFSTRFGPASWIPLTDMNGVPLTTADPFAFVTTTGGRNAADEVKGTPYGRPEDIQFGRLANGNEVFYVSLTSENTVLSVELLSPTTAIVRTFVNYDTINEATGADVNPTQNSPGGSPGADTATNFDDPDNLAMDAWGHLYIVEDEGPADIWRATDSDGDGIAESIGLFASLGVSGSEPSGLIADPNDPYRMIVCVQHPASGNDALWSIESRPYPGTNDDLIMATGVNSTPTDGMAQAIKPAQALDLMNARVFSPDSTLVGSPLIYFYDAFFTGSPPMPPAGSPFLHVNLATTVVVINGQIPSSFQPVLPPAGFYFSAQVPAGLAGISVIVQGGVFNSTVNNGVAAVTDGHEFQFVP